MQIHEIGSPIKRQYPKRVGRGGKRGTTSGRGQKGQKSRAGRRIRPAVRDLIIRIPKHRGFRNKPKSPKPMVFALGSLAKKLKPIASGQKSVVVSPDVLRELKLVPLKYHGDIKILGAGPIDLVLAVSRLKVSESAKLAIEKAGGTVR